MTTVNPFVERGKISNAARFTGRWAELSLLFDQLEARRPVFVVGTPGIGKSSLLTHVMQSAAVNMERFDLSAYYLDVAQSPSAEEVYRVVVEALGKRGATVGALEQALIESSGPVLLCLDNAHVALEREWGLPLLETLVRFARAGRLMLVVAQNGAPPVLSERVAVIRLGAFAPTEVRLLADAYLEGTGVSFTAPDFRRLGSLSLGHPAYLQRAAYHLFESKLRPGYDWRAAFLAEAQETPIPGAPLPPQVFQGGQDREAEDALYGEGEGEPSASEPPRFEMVEPGGTLLYGLPLVLGLVLFIGTGNIVVALVVVVIGVLAVRMFQRWAT